MNDLWQSYQEGRCASWTAILLALAVSIAVRIVGRLLVRPLIVALTRKDIPKILQSRVRRTGFAMTMASLSLGVFIFTHAFWPPDLRRHKIVFEASELLLIIFTGYVVLEIILGLFGDWLPRVRNQTPMAPIIKDLVRALALVGVALLGAKVEIGRAHV